MVEKNRWPQKYVFYNRLYLFCRKNAKKRRKKSFSSSKCKKIVILGTINEKVKGF